MQNTGTPRPYFLPAEINFAALSPEVQLALQEVVQPVYDDLVLRARNSLERATGVTIAFLLTQEVLEQIALGRDALSEAKSKDRERALCRYLKMVGAKHQAQSMLLKLKGRVMPMPALRSES